MVVNLSLPQNHFFERTDTLRRYYEDIRKYKPITLQEELKLINEFHTTIDLQRKNVIKNIILCTNQRFALGVARRYANNENIMDLISEANIGMIEALEEYDITKKVRFITFAVFYIRRAINTYMIRNGAPIRKNNLPKTFHIVSQATNNFMQKELRQPTQDELLSLLQNDYGVNIKDKNDITTLHFSSIDDDGNDEDDVNTSITDYNKISASINEYEKSKNNEFVEVLTQSVLKVLTPIEKKVINYTFGIDCLREYSVKEISELLGFTSERIRQIKKTSLEKMKNEYKKLYNKL